MRFAFGSQQLVHAVPQRLIERHARLALDFISQLSVKGHWHFALCEGHVKLVFQLFPESPSGGDFVAPSGDLGTLKIGRRGNVHVALGLGGGVDGEAVNPVEDALHAGGAGGDPHGAAELDVRIDELRGDAKDVTRAQPLTTLGLKDPGRVDHAVLVCHAHGCSVSVRSDAFLILEEHLTRLVVFASERVQCDAIKERCGSHLQV